MKIKKIVLPVILCFFAIFSSVQLQSSLTPVKVEADGGEYEIGRSNVGSWNGGNFIEQMTAQQVGPITDSNDYVDYIIRYRIIHWGPAGSYTYQNGAVYLYVDGVHRATFTSMMGVWISNANVECDSFRLSIKKGESHLFEFRDNGGSLTSINCKGTVNHPYPKYTVTFNNGFGSNISSQAITKYQNASAPGVSRAGYTFAGWSGAYNNVTSNRTITATWSPNTYSITYNANGGTGAPPTQYFVFNSGAKISTQVPTRAGYTFAGWDYSGNHFNPGQAIPYDWGTFSLIAKWNKIPTMSGTSFYVVEGSGLSNTQIIDGSVGFSQPRTDKDFPDKLVAGNFPMSATDGEDGNITSRIKISKITHADGTVSSSINTSKVGKYTITYSVADNYGNVGTFARTITVLSKSTPKIDAPDRYFYLGTHITEQMILEKAKATDKYDGDISKSIKIESSTIDENKIGKYAVTYRVVNRSNVTVKKTVDFYIVDTVETAATDSNLRYISKEYLGTLEDSSKWKTDAGLNNQLVTSLNKDTLNSIREYKFTTDDVNDVHDFIDEKDFGKQMDGKAYNNLFFDFFKKCQIK